jgi:CheY-like chemotaxis protein
VKADPDLRRIPVVVLTTSEAEEDIVRSYDLHANAYVRKPVDFHQFTDVVGLIEDFWFTVVKHWPERSDRPGRDEEHQRHLRARRGRPGSDRYRGPASELASLFGRGGPAGR